MAAAAGPGAWPCISRALVYAHPHAHCHASACELRLADEVVTWLVRSRYVLALPPLQGRDAELAAALERLAASEAEVRAVRDEAGVAAAELQGAVAEAQAAYRLVSEQLEGVTREAGEAAQQLVALQEQLEAARAQADELAVLKAQLGGEDAGSLQARAQQVLLLLLLRAFVCAWKVV